MGFTIDPYTAALVALTVPLLVFTIFPVVSTWSFNSTARDRWFSYLANRIPRFKDFRDVIAEGELRGKKSKGRGWNAVSIPFFISTLSPVVFFVGIPHSSEAVAAAYFTSFAVALLVITMIVRQWLRRAAMNNLNLASLAGFDFVSKTPKPALRAMDAFESMEGQRAMSPVCIGEPFAFAIFFYTTIVGWPWNLIVAISLLAVGISIAAYGYSYYLDTRYEAENALFVALRHNLPRFEVRADVLLSSGGLFANEVIVAVGQKLRIRNDAGREMDLPWKRIEGLGVKPQWSDSDGG